MGFDEHKVRQALSLAHNNSALAMEMLLRNLPELSLPLENHNPPPPLAPAVLSQRSSSQRESEPSESAKKEDVTEMTPAEEELKFEHQFTTGTLTKLDIMKILVKTFGDYLRFNPVTTGRVIKKGEIIDNVFFKASLDPETGNEFKELLVEVKNHTLEIISESLLNKDSSNLGALSLCLTCLLSYRHGALVQTKEVF